MYKKFCLEGNISSGKTTLLKILGCKDIETILEIVFTFFKLNWKDFVKIDNSLLREGDPISIVSNPKKIKDTLNWESLVSLEETLIKCIEFKISK